MGSVEAAKSRIIYSYESRSRNPIHPFAISGTDDASFIICKEDCWPYRGCFDWLPLAEGLRAGQLIGRYILFCHDRPLRL